MIMTITFENDYNEEITPEQVNLSNAYTKVYTDLGIIIKKEHYRDNILKYINHYKAINENESDIINIYGSGTVPFSTIQIDMLSNMKIETEKSYRGNVLQRIERNLYNIDGYVVCEENYDIDTNLPIYEETKKHFYDLNLDDFFPIMTALYNENGSLSHIEYNSFRSDQDEIWFYLDGTPGVDDLPTLAGLLDISMDEMSYYITATLEP